MTKSKIFINEVQKVDVAINRIHSDKQIRLGVNYSIYNREKRQFLENKNHFIFGK